MLSYDSSNEKLDDKADQSKSVNLHDMLIEYKKLHVPYFVRTNQEKTPKRLALLRQLVDWLTILSKIFQAIWQPSIVCEKDCLFQGDF